MSPSRRLVLLDPGLAGTVGHHADVNGLLLPTLAAGGWAVELWADAAAAADPDLARALPGLRPLLQEAGYIDPRYWSDLAGSLHQASLLRPQLEAAVAAGDPAPVAVWVAHSLMPFQLIALAQLLQTLPPAQVVISLMFAPGEVFAGQPQYDLQAQRQLAETTARTALAALALAVERGGHRLLLGAACRRLIELYRPLCQAAGLEAPRLHPAVVLGADAPTSQQLPSGQLLLHWGERKPDKGRELALRLLAHRLDGGACPQRLLDLPWCFHASSRQPPAAEEAALLARARADGLCRIFEGQVGRAPMLNEIAAAEVALMPYCPQSYAERSSGVLWLYGAARLALERPARVVGWPQGWLAQEAEALGLPWGDLPAGASPEQALAVLAQVLDCPSGTTEDSSYRRQVLGAGFAPWLVEQLHGSGCSSR